MVLVLTLPEGQKEIVELPEGQKPDDLAETHGALLFEVCDSPEEARKRAGCPNGKTHSF